MTDQVQGNQQPPYSAVAIEKRMDGLKLIMANCHPDQVRYHDTLIVPERLQITHQIRHAVRMGWNEHRIRQAGAADPILAGTEFTRLLVFAPHPAHQNFMGLL